MVTLRDLFDADIKLQGDGFVKVFNEAECMETIPVEFDFLERMLDKYECDPKSPLCDIYSFPIDYIYNDGNGRLCVELRKDL